MSPNAVELQKLFDLRNFVDSIYNHEYSIDPDLFSVRVDASPNLFELLVYACDHWDEHDLEEYFFYLRDNWEELTKPEELKNKFSLPENLWKALYLSSDIFSLSDSLNTIIDIYHDNYFLVLFVSKEMGMVKVAKICSYSIFLDDKNNEKIGEDYHVVLANDAPIHLVEPFIESVQEIYD